jgi:hypothetical protein
MIRQGRVEKGGAVTAEFLADPNEDQEAADFFMAKFRKEGIRPGGPLSLVVRVTKIPTEKLEAVEAAVRKLYDSEHVERGRTGFLIKKARLAVYLRPVALERPNLLKVARAMYRLILDHGVTVEIANCERPAGDSPRIWSKEGLRRGLRSLMLAYCILVWVLPIVVMLIFGDLPYLQQRDFLHCLSLSAGGTLALVAVMVVSSPNGLVETLRRGTAYQTAKAWILTFLGFAIFTVFAALWGGSVLGAVVRFTPGAEYSAKVTVVGAWQPSHRSRTVYLTLRSLEGTGDSYLWLSERVSDYPVIRTGDRLLLEGKQNVVGVYIERIRNLDMR